MHRAAIHRQESERAIEKSPNFQMIFSRFPVSLAVYVALGFYCTSNMKYSFYIEFKLWLNMRSKKEWGGKCRARKKNVYLNVVWDENFLVTNMTFCCCFHMICIGDTCEGVREIWSFANESGLAVVIFQEKNGNIWHSQYSNLQIHIYRRRHIGRIARTHIAASHRMMMLM